MSCVLLGHYVLKERRNDKCKGPEGAPQPCCGKDILHQRCPSLSNPKTVLSECNPTKLELHQGRWPSSQVTIAHGPGRHRSSSLWSTASHIVRPWPHLLSRVSFPFKKQRNNIGYFQTSSPVPCHVLKRQVLCDTPNDTGVPIPVLGCLL